MGHITKEQRYTISQMFNNELSGKIISQLIVQSGIREQGYVLVIPADLKKKRAAEVRDIFYRQGIRAVHILNIDNAKNIKKSDILMTEKARIICFTGNGSQKFFKWTKKNRFENHLKEALKNGALIAGTDPLLSQLNLK